MHGYDGCEVERGGGEWIATSLSRSHDTCIPTVCMLWLISHHHFTWKYQHTCFVACVAFVKDVGLH